MDNESPAQPPASGALRVVRDMKVGPPADPQQDCKNPSVRLRKTLLTALRRIGISINYELTSLEASVSGRRNTRIIRLHRQIHFHVAHRPHCARPGGNRPRAC